MFREEKDRELGRLRQERFRKKHKNNAKITPPSPSPSPKRKYIKESEQVIDHLNAVSGRAFTYSKKNLSYVTARLEEGHKVEDFKQVIDAKWKDLNFDKRYFRPSTLFNSDKFEGYLNEDRKPPRVWR